MKSSIALKCITLVYFVLIAEKPTTKPRLLFIFHRQNFSCSANNLNLFIVCVSRFFFFYFAHRPSTELFMIKMKCSYNENKWQKRIERKKVLDLISKSLHWLDRWFNDDDKKEEEINETEKPSIRFKLFRLTFILCEKKKFYRFINCVCVCNINIRAKIWIQ